jgi:hypothetical protein
MKPCCSILCFLLVALISSCSIEKRVHQSGFYIDFNSSAKTILNPTEKSKAHKAAAPLQETYSNETSIIANNNLITAGIIEPVYLPKETEFAIKKETKISNDCDLIIFKNGDELLVKILEVLPEEIKYKRCDNLNGPTYTSKKPDVFMVKYANGVKEVFNNVQTNKTEDDLRTEQRSQELPKQNQVDGRTLQPFGLVGFFLGILGLFFSGIPLGIAAIVFGTVGLGQISKYPNRYSGAGFSAVSIIVGLIALIGAIVVLSAL